MSGLIESATAIMSASERRLEIAARNIANITTPGYKRQVAFTEVMSGRMPGDAALPVVATRMEVTQGKLSTTGNPMDLAISGKGYFQLRGPQGMVYSRQGNLRLGDDGTLLSPSGDVLQQAGGGDLIVEHGPFEVIEDGTIIQQGRPVGRIAIFAADKDEATANADSTFAAPDGSMIAIDDGVVRQGAVESSNVSVGDEMAVVMVASRQAESGARLVQLYDELMGRALTTFGQAGR